MRIYRIAIVQQTLLIALIAAGLLATNGLIEVVNRLADGPQAAQFDSHYQDLVYRSGLVGRAESEIVAVLGKPLQAYSDEADKLRVIYEYQSYRPFRKSPKFQVHCYAGKVVATQIDP
jgi:hypothetical protein